MNVVKLCDVLANDRTVTGVPGFTTEVYCNAWTSYDSFIYWNLIGKQKLEIKLPLAEMEYMSSDDSLSLPGIRDFSSDCYCIVTEDHVDTMLVVRRTPDNQTIFDNLVEMILAEDGKKPESRYLYMLRYNNRWRLPPSANVKPLFSEIRTFREVCEYEKFHEIDA